MHRLTARNAGRPLPHLLHAEGVPCRHPSLPPPWASGTLSSQSQNAQRVFFLHLFFWLFTLASFYDLFLGKASSTGLPTAAGTLTRVPLASRITLEQFEATRFVLRLYLALGRDFWVKETQRKPSQARGTLPTPSAKQGRHNHWFQGPGALWNLGQTTRENCTPHVSRPHTKKSACNRGR